MNCQSCGEPEAKHIPVRDDEKVIVGLICPDARFVAEEAP
jgi:hypothetical protein